MCDNKIKKVIDNFKFKGDFVDVSEFGSGHINKTYLVTFNNEGAEQRYILQQLNANVFKNIDGLMKNVFSVTSYLRGVIKEYGGDPDRETLHSAGKEAEELLRRDPMLHDAENAGLRSEITELFRRLNGN